MKYKEGEYCTNSTVKYFIVRPEKNSLYNWRIIHPTSLHDKLPLHRRKENNFALKMPLLK